MTKQEKLTGLQTYAQDLRNRLARGVYPKRDNGSFLKIDLAKTEKKIERLKLEIGNAPADGGKK